MTDIELLPLPEKAQLANPYASRGMPTPTYGHSDETLTDYARAVAEHNVRLRGGIDPLAVLIRAQEAEARAERLAEAGRRVTAAFRAHGEASSFTRQAERTRHECEAAMLSLADALRDHDQEVGNG